MNDRLPRHHEMLSEMHRQMMASLGGSASSEPGRRLDDLIRQDIDACDLYLDLVFESSVLVTWARNGGVGSTHKKNSIHSPPAPVLVFLHDTIGFFSQELPFSLLIATVLTSLGLWFASLVYISSPEQIAKNSSQRAQPASGRTLERVGKITGMLNCKWADPQTETSHGSNVLLGRRYSLASGLMEITYNTGAKVILQGPVTYEVESNGGYLSLGKLTGKLEKKAEGSNLQSLIPNPSLSAIHYPLFTIRTSTATVTDLGTEFGVEVDQAGVTTSHVFRGSVRVQMVSAEGTAEGEGQVLHANQSVRIEKTAKNREGVGRVTVFKTPSTQDTFAREVPAPKIKMFDLVDAVAGGDGFSGKRGASIDPTTGRRSKAFEFGNPDPGVPQSIPHGDGKCHRVENLPFVDGVFIPDGSRGPIQIDSAGHLFDCCPKTTNLTSNLIWAGNGVIPSLRSPTVTAVLDGVDYGSQGHAFLFLHSNNGIVFDLDAIRKAIPGWTITRFIAVAGNVAPRETALADVWVFIDGQARFRRFQIGGHNGGYSITLPTKPGDRFLSLIVTDGGNGLEGDWIIFGDPRLELMCPSDLNTVALPNQREL